jgi:hypothetical protein
MPFDAHKNLAISSVATAPSPATSGATLTLATGEGARMPAVPFNATVWPASTLPTPVSAEIVRVTAMTGDQITAMTRAQEGTTARAIVVGDLFAATVTVKALTDIELGTNFQAGQWRAAADVASSAVNRGIEIKASTFANEQMIRGWTNGAGFTIASVNTANNSHPASVRFSDAGQVQFYSAPATEGQLRGTMHPSGGFSWGHVTDPGINNISTLGHFLLSGGAQHHVKVADTVAGADAGSVWLGSSPVLDNTRGAYLGVTGNQSANTGSIYINAGAPSGAIYFVNGAVPRGVMYPSGGFTWAGTADPGGPALRVGTGTTSSPGQMFWQMNSDGACTSSVGGSVNIVHIYLQNAAGGCGYIASNGLVTTYATSSDRRLKDDHGRLSDTDVLRRTVVHDFTWKFDGSSGRGVFAQEAIAVAPFVVVEGTDEQDEEGRLKRPWAVDYARYVPDLIVGWQQHDGQVEALTARIEALETALARRPAVDGPSLFAIVVDRLRGWLARLPPLLPVKA